MLKILLRIWIGVSCSLQLLYAQPTEQNPLAVKSPYTTSLLVAGNDFSKSPYTGYTRQHWLAITEKIIAGMLSHINPETGMPEFPAYQAGDSAYEKVRWQEGKEKEKRALERMMMAIIIYTKATGKDVVPGYKGSISAPFINAIIQGTDPKSPGYWGEIVPNDQVGATLALAMYLEPKRYWEPLTPAQKTNLLTYFKKMVYVKTYDNNHYYFHMVPVALLDKNGYDSNRAHLTKMYERLMGWYRGDGWFLDGNNRGFDYYNLWGFQLFNQVLYRYDSAWKAQFGDRIKQTTARFLETLPYLYGRDGGPIPWGRSLTYRFAGNSAIAWAVLNGLSTLPPGQARRMASGSLKYFWEHGCLAENGLLSLGYWGANAGIAENYLYYGDPYWANQGLACLLIPETDPFWTAVEKPIPADDGGGKIAVPGAEFTIRVSTVDGEARLFPVGQPWARPRETWQAGAKYDQHAYSSYLGFCVQGEDGANVGAGRSGYSYDGQIWFYRERAKAIQITPTHLVSRYTLKPKSKTDTELPENRDEVTTHTLVGNDGEVHVFWHNYPNPLYLYMGGYGLAVPHEKTVNQQQTTNTLLVDGGDYYSVIQAIQPPEGRFDVAVLMPRPGWSHTHLFGGKGAFPYWQSTKPISPNVPLIFYVNGTRTRKPTDSPIKVNRQGSNLNIRFEGEWHTIQIPF